jgi:hypothetical protein
MKITMKITMLTGLMLCVISSEAFGESGYEKNKSIYLLGTAPEKKSEVVGLYSGKCFFNYEPNRAIPGILNGYRDGAFGQNVKYFAAAFPEMELNSVDTLSPELENAVELARKFQFKYMKPSYFSGNALVSYWKSLKDDDSYYYFYLRKYQGQLVVSFYAPYSHYEGGQGLSCIFSKRLR